MMSRTSLPAKLRSEPVMNRARLHEQGNDGAAWMTRRIGSSRVFGPEDTTNRNSRDRAAQLRGNGPGYSIGSQDQAGDVSELTNALRMFAKLGS